MKIRYQADNDLDRRIVEALFRLDSGIDFKTSAEAGFHLGVIDPDVLKSSASENRILISHDLKTMPRHFAEFIKINSSPGVILIRQDVGIRDSALWLQFFHDVGAAEDFENTIRIISQAF
jgi:hypothetical protein